MSLAVVWSVLALIFFVWVTLEQLLGVERGRRFAAYRTLLFILLLAVTTVASHIHYLHMQVGELNEWATAAEERVRRLEFYYTWSNTISNEDHHRPEPDS